MKKQDLIIYGFLLSLGIVICWASLRMNYGTITDPGPAFLPFWAGFLIAVISLGLFLNSLWEKSKVSNGSKVFFQGAGPLKPLTILGALALYGLLSEKLGFFICNLLFSGLIFRFVWKKSWWFILKTSLLIDLAFYLILEVLLQVPLPQGILSDILKFF